jgi:hypothetical protein
MKRKIHFFIPVLILMAGMLCAGVNPDGSYSYTIDINLPAGCKNMTPQLGLVYNTRGGDGLLGPGWQLTGLSTGTSLTTDRK